MPTATEASAAIQQRVMVMGAGSQHHLNVNGLPRYRGEILPKEGVNVQLMLEQGSLAPVSREAAKQAVQCADAACRELNGGEPREFADKATLKAHYERGHDKEAVPPFGGLTVVEEEQLECPPKAHHDLAEEGDGRIVTLWHPKTKLQIPRRGRSGSVAGDDR